jgi:hypothetical protein
MECHDSQAAANLKFWFDNKYTFSHFIRTKISIYFLVTSKTVEQLRPSQIRRKAIRFVRYPKVSLVLPFLLEVSVTNVLCLDSEPPARGDGRPQSQPPSSVTVGQPAVAPTRASFRGDNPGGMGRGIMGNGGAGGGTGGIMNGNMTGMGMGNVGMGNVGMGNMGMGGMGMGNIGGGMNMGGGMGVGGAGSGDDGLGEFKYPYMSLGLLTDLTLLVIDSGSYFWDFNWQ